MEQKVKREIDGFYRDIEQNRIMDKIEKEAFARRLNEGLGDRMIQHIQNPQKVSKWAQFKHKLKKALGLI